MLHSPGMIKRKSHSPNTSKHKEDTKNKFESDTANLRDIKEEGDNKVKNKKDEETKVNNAQRCPPLTQVQIPYMGSKDDRHDPIPIVRQPLDVTVRPQETNIRPPVSAALKKQFEPVQNPGNVLMCFLFSKIILTYWQTC